MKKAYEKPVILFENFSLSTSIAGDCTPPFVGNQSKGSCGVITSSGLTVFVDNTTGCDIPDDDGATDNRLCYHRPYDEGSLFNS